MIILYVPTETGTKPEFREIRSDGTGSDLDVLMDYAYSLKLHNKALQTRNLELEKAYGCESCRGNPLTMATNTVELKARSNKALTSIFKDVPSYFNKNA